MNQKSFIIAAILAATVVSAIATPLAYADESETNTDQEIKQKNVGSGYAQQNNCASNGIDDSDAIGNCDFNNDQD
jgi:uncharacterized protein involved in high-affinity Fe2+ transport